ncbi:uncharacterized protein LOC120157544 [Hibiscus syriacus]|uniref:uncharacterized protein LOC120157544 n=1 Tax=Hibiscus syriacus TaxID=106335 RepID=UPI0019222DB2|nr:uncharacterized protein LOC120157544 [Hibiscus syriacus]
MASKRPSRTKKLRKNNSSFNFQTLISSLSSPQRLKPETLEGLYLLLLTLSCSDSECNLNFSETEFNCNDYKHKFKDTREISCVLLDKLNAKFNELFSALNDASPHPIHSHFIFHVNVEASIKELTLLLRCCVVVSNCLIWIRSFLSKKVEFYWGY